eukprot:Sspe_Gene.40753::Locus_19698_Transcript_1_1_Confidence_1.000_Length_2500::g.40753::m.40753
MVVEGRGHKERSKPRGPERSKATSPARSKTRSESTSRRTGSSTKGRRQREQAVEAPQPPTPRTPRSEPRPRSPPLPPVHSSQIKVAVRASSSAPARYLATEGSDGMKVRLLEGECTNEYLVDHVIPSGVPLSEALETSVRHVTASSMEGRNGTLILCSNEKSGMSMVESAEAMGRVCEEVMKLAAALPADEYAQVRLSIVECNGTRIRDLLSYTHAPESKDLSVRWDVLRGPVLDGAVQVMVRDLASALRAISAATDTIVQHTTGVRPSVVLQLEVTVVRATEVCAAKASVTQTQSKIHVVDLTGEGADDGTTLPVVLHGVAGTSTGRRSSIRFRLEPSEHRTAAAVISGEAFGGNCTTAIFSTVAFGREGASRLLDLAQCGRCLSNSTWGTELTGTARLSQIHADLLRNTAPKPIPLERTESLFRTLIRKRPTIDPIQIPTLLSPPDAALLGQHGEVLRELLDEQRAPSLPAAVEPKMGTPPVSPPVPSLPMSPEPDPRSQERIRKFEEEVKALENMLSTSNTSNAKLSAEVTLLSHKLAAALREAERAAESASSASKPLREELAKAEDTRQEAVQLARTLEDECERQRGVVADLELQINTLRMQARIRESEAEAERCDMEREISFLRSQVKVLEGQRDADIGRATQRTKDDMERRMVLKKEVHELREELRVAREELELQKKRDAPPVDVQQQIAELELQKAAARVLVEESQAREAQAKQRLESEQKALAAMLDDGRQIASRIHDGSSDIMRWFDRIACLMPSPRAPPRSQH